MLALTIHFIAGCKRNDNPAESSNPVPATTKGVYVLNEGNFGRSNASLTFYSPDSNRAYQDVFGSVNDRPLGDTGNDIVIYGTKGFIVVNQSHKIEVFSTQDNTSLGTIQLPNKSPRCIAVINSTKAYVTNWGDNSVSIVNPTTLAVEKDSIAVGNAPEGITVFNGKVYVCNSGYGSGNTVTVIDAMTDVIVKQITVGMGPETIGVDADGDIFVQCSGYSDWSNPVNDSPGSVSVIDAASDTVKSTITMPLETYGHPGEIAVSKNGYAMIKVRDGIAKIDTKSDLIISNVFISAPSAYSIAVDDVTDFLYVSDAKSYTENGEVKIYNPAGSEIAKFSTGIIPGDFAFKR